MLSLLEYIFEDTDKCIIAIAGNLGKAKTLTAVALAYYLAKGLNKNTIYTNTPLDYGDNNLFKTKFIEYYDDLRDLHEPPKNNSIYLLDEIHRIADSREGRKKQNLFTSDITTDIRKGDNLLIIATPHLNLVEKRIAQLCTFVIYPRIIYKDINNYQIKVELQILDIDYMEQFVDYCDLGTFIDCYDTKYKPKKLKWMDE